MMLKAIKVHPKDNMAVALTALSKGETVSVEGKEYTLLNNIKVKHKMALEDFVEGAELIMYGVLVGKTTEAIAAGDAVTTENIKHEATKTYEKTGDMPWDAPNVEKWKDKTFNGFHRTDGQVGTSNVWLFFPLVFCENKNNEILKDAFEKEMSYFKASQQQLQLRSLIQQKVGGETPAQPASTNAFTPIFKNIEGIKFITHDGGCGGIRQDAVLLGKLLAGYVNNPNVAGATVLSLGCQNLQVDIFMNEVKRINPDCDKPILVFDQQEIGKTDQMLQRAISETFEKLTEVDKTERKPAPLSKLKVGLECGGSDGFSGISANPALGFTSDQLAALGATVILSEFPELVGVEQEIVNRCVNEEDGQKFLKILAEYEEKVIAAGSGFDMNPSPGNIKDGLITDAMKSAGAARKGGSSPINAVLDYGEYTKESGLNLLCTPGNDVESTTGLAGAGANIILFTTGLGTPTGNPVTPVIKVSSNTEMAQRMSDIIDIDTGPIIKGTKTLPDVSDEIIDYIIRVASGEIQSKAQINKQDDFIVWKPGVSL